STPAPHLMLLPQRGRERIPLRRRRALETDRVLVIDVRGLLTHHRHHHPGQVRIEERRILLPRRGPPRQLAHLDPTHRRTDVGHLVVEARDLVRILLLHPLVPQQPHLPRDLRRGAGDHPTLPRSHVLRRIQREHPALPESAHLTTLPGRAVRLRRVLEHPQP